MRRGVYFIGAAIAVAVWMGSASVGCSSVGQERGGDPAGLEEEARDFHSNMLWARYDHARDSVHEAYRPTFDGRFEERGEDYEIMELTMKRADLVEEGFAAIVEVEQRWVQLPSTTVENERFVERWVYEHDRWWMRERMLRSEYRERGEVFDSEPDGDEAGPREATSPTEDSDTSSP